MGDLIYFDEARIKQELGEAQRALQYARELQLKGVDIPNDIFGRLEQIIVNLEDKLVNLVLDDNE